MPRIDAPTRWRLATVIDTKVKGDKPGRCDACGKTGLRYVHVFDAPMRAERRVGCECARRLCRGYDPTLEERRLRKRANRRSRWLSRKWKRKSFGDTLTIRIDRGKCRVTVFEEDDFYRFRIVHRGATEIPREYEPTADAAKLVAFEYVADIAGW